MGLRQRVQRKDEVARTIQRLMTSFMLEIVAILRVISAVGILLKAGTIAKLNIDHWTFSNNVLPMRNFSASAANKFSPLLIWTFLRDSTMCCQCGSYRQVKQINLPLYYFELSWETLVIWIAVFFSNVKVSWSIFSLFCENFAQILP